MSRSTSTPSKNSRSTKKSSLDDASAVPRWETERVSDLIGRASILSAKSCIFVCQRLAAMAGLAIVKPDIQFGAPSTPAVPVTPAGTRKEPTPPPKPKEKLWDSPIFDKFPPALWLRKSTKIERTSTPEGKDNLALFSAATALITRGKALGLDSEWFKDRWAHFPDPKSVIPKSCPEEMKEQFKLLDAISDPPQSKRSKKNKSEGSMVTFSSSADIDTGDRSAKKAKRDKKRDRGDSVVDDSGVEHQS